MVEVAVAATAELGERPIWDEARGELVWVDVLAGVVHRQRPGGLDHSFTVNSTVGAVGLRVGGGYVVAAGNCFLLTDSTGAVQGQLIAVPGLGAASGAGLAHHSGAQAPALVRFNDGAVDAAGRFWAGTTSLTGEPRRGALYCLEVDGTVRQVFHGVTECNGIGWSPDSRTMYFVDSGEQRVRAYDFDLDAGEPRHLRDFVLISALDGTPDGLTVDAAGNVWIALWGGSAVRCYSPEGAILATVTLPVSRVTCPGFGGPDLNDLYITTAWEGATGAGRAAEPLAGSVFRMRAAGPGQKTARYGG